MTVAVADALRALGDAPLSETARTMARAAVMADIVKIHVHTDTPEAVLSYAQRWGPVDTTRAEDMRVQRRRLSHTRRRAVPLDQGVSRT